MTKVHRSNRRSGQKVNTGLELRQFGPITDNQVKAFKHYQSDNNLVLYGCAGTGKTFIALYLALQEILNKESHIRKIVLIRTPQATKQIGHLPGTEKQKMEAYEAPYRAICSELFGRDDAYEILY
jgi:predicted ribonuclease YlaK